MLSRQQIWNEFLHYVRDGGGWRGIEFALPSLDDTGRASAVDLSDLAGRLGALNFGSGEDLPFREDE